MSATALSWPGPFRDYLSGSVLRSLPIVFIATNEVFPSQIYEAQLPCLHLSQPALRRKDLQIDIHLYKSF